jgi:hypothetical protein
MTTRHVVLPRDMEPGDKIDRIDKDLNIVTATVSKVEKVRRFNSTCYRVSLKEFDELPSHQRPWSGNRHLSPFILQPRQKMAVERESRG